MRHLFPTTLVSLLTILTLPEESGGFIKLNHNPALLGLGGAFLTAGAFKTGYFLGSRQHFRPYSPFGHFGRPYYRGRRRRDVATGPEAQVKPSEEFLEKLEEVLKVDRYSCTLLLTCHVASLDRDSLSPKLASLLLPFEHEDVSETPRAYDRFKKAVMEGKNNSPCSQLFDTCPTPPESLMSQYLEIVERFLPDIPDKTGTQET